MASPSGRRRPLSTSGYEPLIQPSKPKPPPKPKPQILKAFSTTAVTTSDSSSSSSEKSAPSGYFQPGGASGVGYCLSSVYKAKKTGSEQGDKTGDEPGRSSPKSQEVKLKFSSKDGSRPSLTSLPAKFRVSFEERNRQSPLKPDTEPATGILIPIPESNGSSVKRRSPPAVPRNSSYRMSNPFPLTMNPSKSLPTNLVNDAPSEIKRTRSSSLKKDPSVTTTTSKPNMSPTLTSPSTVASSPTSISSSSFSPVPASKKPVTYAQPPPFEMNYTETEHPLSVFGYLEKFRSNGDMCDATFIVNGRELKAHRVVLAACSQFFESMFIGEFAEPANEPIMIEELSDTALEMMISFAYSSHIKITEKHVYSIFEAADLLQFTGVKGACFKFFKQQINKSNCIGTWLFAESHNCVELLDAALKYIEYNFLDIVRGREFLNIDQPEVVNGITCREDLAITSEEQVYEAVLNWVLRDLDKRKKCALEVFKNVRFASMSKEYLMHIVDNEPLIKEDPDLLQLLIEALESHVTIMRGTLRKKMKNKSNEHPNPMRARTASMAVEVVNVQRENSSLGLRIMGGVDHPLHVFRQGDKSGIFVLQILENSAVAKVGKLSPGDRILQVNGLDMTKVTHDEAIRVLKTSTDPLSFLVRHEPAPVGLKEVILVTKSHEGFGFVIAGGVNDYTGNPLDATDEGIFVSQIVPGGAAEQDGRLKVGNRILQVNSISMLGRTHREALKVLQGVLDRLNLLICDGYDPAAVPVVEDDLESDSFL